MLITENLGKTYKTKVRSGLLKRDKLEVEAVKGLNMEVRKGQIVGLLGINGAGKTTTIKMLSTLLEPSKGSASIDGLNLVKDAVKIKKVINMIAGGERMLYWRLTGRENLWYYGQLYDIPEGRLDRRIDELLSLVGLEDSQHMPVERYSKGMKQRLQIARGLINDPNYIFMDEPTIGLDAPIAKELRNYARKLAHVQGKSIILTSHYMHEVEELCEYIYVLDKGNLIVEGTPKELAMIAWDEKTLRIEVNNFTLEAEKAIQHLCSYAGAELHMENNEQHDELVIKSTEDISGQVAEILSKFQVSIKKFYVEEPKLEDAIIKLSGRGQYA
ncbi:MAG: ABC transporter ATP-binding protein [Bacillota bacterium]